MCAELKIFKGTTATYGCLLLIPILSKRIPEELTVIISQKFGNNLWTLDLMLEYINEELQAKERCASFHKSVEEQRPQKKNLYFTARNLHTQQEQSQQQKGRCVFCLKNDHPPSQCKQVTNIKSRVDILRKYAKCFKCLKPGHFS